MTKSGQAVCLEQRIAKQKKRTAKATSAIRARCIDCTGGSFTDVRNCSFEGCTLHPYRGGSNPFHGKEKPSHYLPLRSAIRVDGIKAAILASHVDFIVCAQRGRRRYAASGQKGPVLRAIGIDCVKLAVARANEYPIVDPNRRGGCYGPTRSKKPVW